MRKLMMIFMILFAFIVSCNNESNDPIVNNDPIVPTTSIVPDTIVPDTIVPDTEVPDTEVPDTEVPDTEVPDTEGPTEDEIMETAFKKAAGGKSFKAKIGSMPVKAAFVISSDGSTMTAKAFGRTDNYKFVKAISNTEGLYTCADPFTSTGKYLRMNVAGAGSVTGNGETESEALD